MGGASSFRIWGSPIGAMLKAGTKDNRRCGTFREIRRDVGRRRDYLLLKSCLCNDYLQGAIIRGGICYRRVIGDSR